MDAEQDPEGLADIQRWKIERISETIYKIIPKSGEAYGFALASESTVAQGDWNPVMQKVYTNDSDYTDQWILEPVT